MERKGKGGRVRLIVLEEMGRKSAEDSLQTTKNGADGKASAPFLWLEWRGYAPSASLCGLLGVRHTACLSDDRNLHLTRIGHFVLNLFCNFRAELLALCIVHLVGTDDDTQLASGLDSIRLRYARIAHGYCLKVVETLDVGLYDFAACTGACTGDGIAHLNNRGQQGRHLNFVVVGGDSVADVRFLLEFLGYLAPYSA